MRPRASRWCRMWKTFRRWNVEASFRTTPHSLWETRGFAIYDLVARGLLGEPAVQTVVDVGAGRSWYFGDDYKRLRGIRLIGVDADPAELALNPSLDERYALDACESLGIADGAADLILARAVVEHLHDTEAFYRNAFRALRPGGRLAMVFANAWAPPILLNRVLPAKMARALLRRLVPGSEGYQGFKAYYDKCLHSEARTALARVGFVVDYDYNAYYSSSYFQFFLPLHMLSIAGDYFRMMLAIRNLSSMNLFVARKPL
jgi:SAM-dependent methyltransferase